MKLISLFYYYNPDEPDKPIKLIANLSDLYACTSNPFQLIGESDYFTSVSSEPEVPLALRRMLVQCIQLLPLHTEKYQNNPNNFDFAQLPFEVQKQDFLDEHEVKTLLST